METIAYLFTYVIPYVAVVVFIGGIIYQVHRWSTKGVPNVRLSLFPRPQGRFGRLLDGLLDMFTLKGLLRVNRPLWAGGFTMHLGLLFLLVGHVRVFADVPFVWNLLQWGEAEVAQFSRIAGITAGILFMVPLFYLLARRFSGAVKWLSTPEDYFLLALLIAIAITGNHMRFLAEVDVQQLNGFFKGLATFQWVSPPAGAGQSFVFHFAFVQILMIYFPFSKLVHTIGTLFAKMVARS